MIYLVADYENKYYISAMKVYKQEFNNHIELRNFVSETNVEDEPIFIITNVEAEIAVSGSKILILPSSIYNEDDCEAFVDIFEIEVKISNFEQVKIIFEKLVGKHDARAFFKEKYLKPYIKYYLENKLSTI